MRVKVRIARNKKQLRRSSFDFACAPKPDDAERLRRVDVDLTRGDATLERARCQLIVREAHGVQECIPAGIIVEIRQEWIASKIAETRILLLTRPLEPFESFVLVAAIRVDIADLIGSYFVILCDQLSERRVGFGNTLLRPARTTDNEKPRIVGGVGLQI